MSWEEEFANKSEVAAELLASMLFDCHRDDIPPKAQPLMNKLLNLKIVLDKAQAKALDTGNVTAEDEEQEISSVTLQSTSVSYVTSANNPFSSKAKEMQALGEVKKEYDSLYRKIKMGIRRFSRGCYRED